MIRRCDNCRPHAYQDAEHGPMMRVMNLLPPDSSGSRSARCTVCGTEHMVQRKREKPVEPPKKP